MFEGLTNECEAAGHKVVQVNANGDPAQQASDIENLVQAGCDCIVIENGDQFSLQNAVKEAVAAGVHVISYETGYFPGIDCMYQLNSIKVQADICMQLAAKVGFGGKVITTGHQDVFALRAGKYIHDAFLAEYDFEEVAHVQTTFPGTTEVTYKGLDSALTANPDVVAIFTSQDLEAMGAFQALKEHDLYGKVYCVGVDGEVDVLNDIKDGDCTVCTAISDLDGANASIVKTCEALCAGEYVPSFVEIPYDIVDKSNVDDFLAKAKEDAEKYAE
jgi:ribose transport system substrate-binding protein